MIGPRVVWFAAGTAAGLYASIKARQVAYRLSMPGLIDQTQAAAAGLREFGRELHDGMAAKEHELRMAALAGPEPQLNPELPTKDHT